MKILKQNIAYGTLGLNGSLGYHCDIANDRVLLPESAGPYSDSLSAHAPSDLFISLEHPASIRGALNGSGWLHDGGTCEFWVDHHWIGDVKHSSSPTPWIHLPPGEFLLRTRCTKNNWGAHTVWLFRQSDLPPRDRLALTTLGCYPENQIKESLYWLHLSAAKQGILLHIFGVGEGFETWFSAKIRRMRGWMNVLPECYSHAIYLDGNDACVLGGERELQNTLAAFGATVIGAESCCWPEKSQRWSSLFSSDVPERYPQAGGWGGEIRGTKGILETLSLIESVRDKWSSYGAFNWLNPCRHLNDDQFLWQAAYLAHEDAFVRDTGFRLFANMSCTNTDIGDTRRMHVEGNRIVCANGNRPVCLHFSGRRNGGKSRLGVWCAFLGVAK